MENEIEIRAAYQAGVLLERRNEVEGSLRRWIFGGDSPKEIWEAMNEAVPGVICSRVRLLSQDGEVLMTVEEHTDSAIIDALGEWSNLAKCYGMVTR